MTDDDTELRALLTEMKAMNPVKYRRMMAEIRAVISLSTALASLTRLL